VNREHPRRYAELASAFLAKGIARYGLPTSGPLYDANLSALTNEHLHDFRLRELPQITRDEDILTRGPLSILDLGCGPGSFMFRALLEGHNAYGLDLDDGKIALARAWASERALPEAWADRVIIADGGDMPFESETFDLVSSYHVLEHVQDLPSVLYEAVRVTKHGGWLQLCAPDYRMSFDTHYSMAWPRFMPPAQGRIWAEAMGRPADGVGTFYYVTAPQVAALLQALGCEIVTLELKEHRAGTVRSFSGTLGVDSIIFRSSADVGAFAREILRLTALEQLPPIYDTCLEFTIAARRM
jgi:SAM-dependent methyltransferase